jgi:hypothetical protein
MAKKLPAKKTWAFLVYIAGDNNLSDSGLLDLEELCKEGASPRVHVGVEIDTEGDFDGSIRYEITEKDWSGKSYRTVIQRLKERDSGAPKSLRSFLQWGLKRYPATNRIAVVWGHGAGFRTIRRDIAPDDFGGSLDMSEIENVLKSAGIGRQKKLAIIGFDACLMNMIEVAHHLKGYADILVGSQQTEPGDGWPYDKVLAAVKSKPTNRAIATQIVNDYIRYYKDRGESGVTQSAILLAKTESVIADLHDLGLQLQKALRDDTHAAANRAKIRRLRVEMQTFDFADYVDLIQMATKIANATELTPIKRAAKALSKSAALCVIHSEKYGGSVSSATGISVWFPAERRLYYEFRGKYLALNCNSRRRQWVDFLDAFHD